MNCPKCAAKELTRVYAGHKNGYVLLDPPAVAEVYCLVPGRNGTDEGVLTDLARAKHRCIARRTGTPPEREAARA